MKLRMCPRPTFQTARAQRQDLARSFGKEARSTFVGGDVEVDNAVLQLLRDPLTAHGPQRARPRHRAAPGAAPAPGKLRLGKITLHRFARRAQSSSSSRSDGAERSDGSASWRRPGARSAGAMNAGVSDAQILDLLFRAGLFDGRARQRGFGRGVGLDCCGAVNISPAAGHGRHHDSAGQGHDGDRFVLAR